MAKPEVIEIKERAKRGEADDIKDGLKLAEIMKQAFIKQFRIKGNE